MSSRLERKFREAVNRFQARDLAGAERGCGEILNQAPGHPEALHLLGMIRLAGGNAREAVALIERAVERDPRNPAVLENLGLAYLAAGDAAGAEPHLRRALGLGATHATLHMRLGLALMSQRRLAEAVAAMRAAAEKAPDDPDVLLNLGNALAEEGQTDDALACYRKILALHPDRVHARFNIGTQLRRSGRLEDAEAAFRALLDIAPHDADVWHNLGVVYQQQARLDEAAACYRRALVLDADHIHAQNNLGNVLRGQGNVDAAVALYERAIAARPDHADGYINLGNARSEQERYREAEALYRKAISLEPASCDAQNNLGDVLFALGRLDDAVVCFQRSLELSPDFAPAHYNLALVHLFRQDFERGWPEYERRLQCVDARMGTRRDLASVGLYERLPRWGGPAEAIEGNVAIWTEQGIGDQVLFSTLIPELIETGVPFVYEVDSRLLDAYERAFPGCHFVAQREPPRQVLQRSSRVLLAGSLPALFRTSRKSFARQPATLLGALPERVAHYRRELSALGPELKVALSWWSARKDSAGPKKSVRLGQLAPLLGLAGMRFVDVQYGDTAAERRAVEDATGVRLIRFEEVDHYNDLEELLAILEASDLVVTTSNATAHFAGALGKRTWLLYPADRAPFHYWAHGGSYRSLWYPSVEIVTGTHLAEWASLIQHVAEELKSMTGDQRRDAVSPADDQQR